MTSETAHWAWTEELAQADSTEPTQSFICACHEAGKYRVRSVEQEGTAAAQEPARGHLPESLDIPPWPDMDIWQLGRAAQASYGVGQPRVLGFDDVGRLLACLGQAEPGGEEPPCPQLTLLELSALWIDGAHSKQMLEFPALIWDIEKHSVDSHQLHHVTPELASALSLCLGKTRVRLLPHLVPIPPYCVHAFCFGSLVCCSR